jgi:hypothetical protein
MRRLLLPILVATLCTACAVLPGSDENTGIVCQRGVGPGGVDKDGVDPLAAGEPMAGLDVTSMSPAEVGTAAVERGLAVTWRYGFDIGVRDGARGYSECWCVAPAAGRVTDVLYDSTGALIVFVDSGQVLAAPRQQPHLGWGCEETTAAATVSAPRPGTPD